MNENVSVQLKKLIVPVDVFMGLYAEYCKYQKSYSTAMSLFHSVLVSDNIDVSDEDLDEIYTDVVTNFTLFRSIQRQAALVILKSQGIAETDVIIDQVDTFDNKFVVIYYEVGANDGE